MLRITQYGAITWRGQQSNYESWEELTTRSPWRAVIAAKKMEKEDSVSKCVLVCDSEPEKEYQIIITLPSHPFTRRNKPHLPQHPTASFMLPPHMM